MKAAAEPLTLRDDQPPNGSTEGLLELVLDDYARSLNVEEDSLLFNNLLQYARDLANGTSWMCDVT